MAKVWRSFVKFVHSLVTQIYIKYRLAKKFEIRGWSCQKGQDFLGRMIVKCQASKHTYEIKQQFEIQSLLKFLSNYENPLSVKFHSNEQCSR